MIKINVSKSEKISDNKSDNRKNALEKSNYSIISERSETKLSLEKANKGLLRIR